MSEHPGRRSVGSDEPRVDPKGDPAAALTSSEERYRTLFEQAPIGVFVYDRTLHIAECNARFVQILQSKMDRLVGLDLRSLRDKRILPAMEAAAAGDVAHYAGPYYATTSEARLWISMRLTPLRDRASEVVAVMGIIEDITEQKLKEAALMRSEARFRTLVEFSPDLIGVMRGGRLLYVNPTCTNHWGYEPGELVGKSVAELVHPDDLPLLRTRLDIEAHGIGAMQAPLEYRLVRKDGTIVYDEIASIVVDYDGAPAMLSLGRDVTDRKLMQARLLQADRMAAVGTLAAGVAHEINNPLAYLMANLEVVALRTIPDLAARVKQLEADISAGSDTEPRHDLSDRVAKLTHMIEIARDGAERVRHTVRDLKTFSRADDDRRALVDVRRVLDASINIAWNEIRHRAQLVREYADVPPVRANESRLGQVFLNLLVNAAQALPVGMASQNQIRVRALLQGRCVAVEICDTGSGISKDHLPRLFDPFFTTKPVGVGTGLGLWICKGIVDGLGGSIHASSESGGQTTFRVELPACGPDSIPPARPASEVPPRTARRGRILVVDDEAPLAKVLASAISLDHDVVVATSGREALELLADDSAFDIILCDLMMPDVSGIDLFQQLQARLPEVSARVIFVTGGAFTARAREFLDNVPNTHVDKPFDIEKLRALLRERVV